MATFTREAVLKTLADIVDEYGADHVYEYSNSQCYYSDADGNPSCIVGHVIYRLDPETFARIYAWENGENGDYGERTSCAVRSLGNEGFELGWESEREAASIIDALGHGQATQDLGGTWGEAEDTVRAVLGEAPRHGEA